MFAGDIEKNLLDIFENNVARLEGKLLYRFRVTDDISNEVTYKEFYENTLKVAHYLRYEIGLQSPERALILYPPGIDYLYAFYGCLFAGIIAVPAYPPDYNNIERIVSIIDDCSPAVILTDRLLGEKLNSFFATNNLLSPLTKIVSIPDLSTLNQPLNFRNTHVTQDSIAFLQYTSGSTSSPKGVVIAHQNLMDNCSHMKKANDARRNSEVVSWLPPYHDMGLIGTIIYPFAVGLTSTLMSPLSFIKKPIRWLHAISSIVSSDHIFSPGPNFSFQLCCDKISDEDAASLDLSKFKVAACGAEPIRIGTYERFYQKFKVSGFRRECFVPVYGLAESTLLVSGTASQRAPTITKLDVEAFKANTVALHIHESNRQSISIMGCGRVIDQHELLIVDPITLKRCAADEIGEVWLNGPSIAKKYWKKDLEINDVFDAFTSIGDGPFFRTGDLGFVLNNELYISGRLKDCLIINGKNHYPQDIELTISNISPIFRRDCAAVFTVGGIGNEVQENVVAIQEVVRNHATADFSTLFKEVSRAVFLKHNLLINDIVLIEQSSLPKTSSGKIQRTKTKHLFLEGDLNVVARN